MSSSAQDFLIEIGTEELPPKALRSLLDAFEQNILAGLKAGNIPHGDIKQHLAAPRRLAVLIPDVETQQPDKEIELLGPAVAAAFDDDDKPTGAALGFAKKAGVEVSDLQQVDSPKGPRLAHVSTEPGKAVSELLPAIVNAALKGLPIPKRMRWGASREEFVRPTHWILMLHGDQVVATKILGLQAGNKTRGHRFHANHEIVIKQPADYVEQLRSEGRVLVDYDERKAVINTGVTELAQKQLRGTAVISDNLLEEVTSLVEWPVPLAGKFEERFLDVPSEALISSMREHQKYFHVVDENNQLLPNFITVANIESRDPARVIDGNERVIRPRLADAAFFYETDKKTSFEIFRERLKPIVFQEKLGSIYEKTERIALLAAHLAPLVGANPNDAQRAGELCKCDLVSDMVQEFDDLQGLMGRYYAQASGENEEISVAMEEHYLPTGAGDRLPGHATAKAVALADRLDTLTGIFGIGQKPTGSKDPFALRRASLGVLRILVENNIQISLKEMLEKAFDLHSGTTQDRDTTIADLLVYMLDRFGAWFKDEHIATECYLAVQELGLDNPADIHARVLAVSDFSKTTDAAALAAANKRVANILAKTETASLTGANADLFESEAEASLYEALKSAVTASEPLVAKADYQGAMSTLAKLRQPVDQFFDQVMVMVDDETIKNNRLCLLQELRDLFLSIADISLLNTGD